LRAGVQEEVVEATEGVPEAGGSPEIAGAGAEA
jgi:hypothetical protein